MNSSADTAKFRFCASRKRKVVIPIKLPRLSNKPPPEEPGEIGVTFHKAREQARIILADALRGNDPVADQRADRNAPTVAGLSQDYIEQHGKPKKRPRSVANDLSMLDRMDSST